MDAELAGLGILEQKRMLGARTLVPLIQVLAGERLARWVNIFLGGGRMELITPTPDVDTNKEYESMQANTSHRGDHVGRPIPQGSPQPRAGPSRHAAGSNVSDDEKFQVFMLG